MSLPLIVSVFYIPKNNKRKQRYSCGDENNMLKQASRGLLASGRRPRKPGHKDGLLVYLWGMVRAIRLSVIKVILCVAPQKFRLFRSSNRWQFCWEGYWVVIKWRGSRRCIKTNSLWRPMCCHASRFKSQFSVYIIVLCSPYCRRHAAEDCIAPSTGITSVSHRFCVCVY